MYNFNMHYEQLGFLLFWSNCFNGTVTFVLNIELDETTYTYELLLWYWRVMQCIICPTRWQTSQVYALPQKLHHQGYSNQAPQCSQRDQELQVWSVRETLQENLSCQGASQNSHHGPTIQLHSVSQNFQNKCKYAVQNFRTRNNCVLCLCVPLSF